jgi:hypothetical protein
LVFELGHGAPPLTIVRARPIGEEGGDGNLIGGGAALATGLTEELRRHGAVAFWPLREEKIRRWLAF